jgi:hypothetical protein
MMPVKKIPAQLKEYMEKMIVRGSAGYECVEALLKQNSEEQLVSFLEFYESKMRDTLLDESSSEENDVDIFSRHKAILNQEKNREEEQENKLQSLFQMMARDGDED